MDHHGNPGSGHRDLSGMFRWPEPKDVVLDKTGVFTDMFLCTLVRMSGVSEERKQIFVFNNFMEELWKFILLTLSRKMWLGQQTSRNIRLMTD